MNQIRQIQALNKRELEAGVSPNASWHTDYRDTAFVYIGGLPFELSEGDVITIFSQYGEPTYINLVRDKETGKSKGFAFLKYEDQRSTDLAVDNLGGATIMGRMLRVDHTRYKIKDGEEIRDNTHGENEEASDGDDASDDGNERRRRKHRDRGSDGEGEKERPLLKEEKELQLLIQEHDDDDPMKEYLVQEKREEVDKAVKEYEYEQKRRSKEERKHRKRHHHHRSRGEGDEDGERRRRHRSKSPAKDEDKRSRHQKSYSRSPDRSRGH